MSTLASSCLSTLEHADEVVRAALHTQWDGLPAVILDSPPGAGKTGVVERLAVQSSALLEERCMVVTPTNAQAFDLARRLAGGFLRLPFVLFHSKQVTPPADLVGLGNLRCVTSARDLPDGPGVFIGNAHKWGTLDRDFTGTFDVLVCDEAYQLPDYRFHAIANLAPRVVLVGDPGQIAPVVTCTVERWADDPGGPHVRCPDALVHRRPDICRLQLPISRRLVPDTVALLQPAFYPSLPFQAVVAPDARRPEFDAATTHHPIDPVLARAAAGESLVQVELPERVTGEHDPELAQAMVASIGRLLERGGRVVDERGVRALTPEGIGVVCAHVSQVAAVRQRLPGALQGVLVDTADRFQGLERDIMLVHHPVSGRAEPRAFHTDAGRLCVMLSRHRLACLVFTRGGALERLQRTPPSGERVLGVEGDPEFEGWRAQVELLSALRSLDRVLSWPT